MEATRVGSDTQLAQMAQLVEDAQNGKADVQRLADRVSAVFVPIVIGLSLVTLAAWLLTGHSATAAFTAAVAVLIIACPCALGLATPTALLRRDRPGRTARHPHQGPTDPGVHPPRRHHRARQDRNRDHRAHGREPGPPGPRAAGFEQVLAIAGALEDASEHPIGRAIAKHASETGIDLTPVEDFTGHGGNGVTGAVGGHAAQAGRRSWLAEQWSLTAPANLVELAESAETAGRTPVWVAWDGSIRAVIVVSDTIKDGTRRHR